MSSQDKTYGFLKLKVWLKGEKSWTAQGGSRDMVRGWEFERYVSSFEGLSNWQECLESVRKAFVQDAIKWTLYGRYRWLVSFSECICPSDIRICPSDIRTCKRDKRNFFSLLFLWFWWLILGDIKKKWHISVGQTWSHQK